VRGYFQRLLDLTGIIPADGKLERKGARLAGTMPHLQADAVPLHIEETKYVAPGPQTLGDSVAILNPTASAPLEGQDLPLIATPAPEGGSHRTERRESEPVTQETEKSELAECIIKDERDQVSTSQESSAPNARLSTSQAADSIVNPSRQGEEDIKSRPLAPELNGFKRPAAVEEVADFRTDESAAKAPNGKPSPGRSETDQITLKEVLDWVAATPSTHDSEAHPQGDNQIEDFGQHPVAANPAQPSFAVRPLMTEASPAPQPEVHDFHFSIGTISLTIEEPKSEIAPIRPQRAAPEQPAPLATNGASRLRRHYLRIR